MIGLHRIRHRIKNLRNDLWLEAFLSQQVPELSNFLESLNHRWGSIQGSPRVLVIVAFERPEVLNLCLAAIERHLPSVEILVFDNSRSADKRQVIRALCKSRDTPYLGLPPTATRHPNRSHGLAMTWIWQRVLSQLPIESVGFIDHDLIATQPNDPFDYLQHQVCYGSLNSGQDDTWNLWAGYSFFRSSTFKSVRPNFLYDFSLNLDTGGRNWQGLYSKLNRGALKFASDEVLGVAVAHESFEAQMIDGAWLHLGGVSYNDNFQVKQRLFGALETEMLGVDGRSPP